MAEQSIASRCKAQHHYMKLETHEFEIIGLSELLMNNPDAMGMDFKPPPGEKDEAKQKRYDVEADASAYRNPDGTFYLPIVAFRAALLSGAKGVKYGKLFATNLLASTVFGTEPRKPVICDPKTWKPLKKRERLVTSCVPPNQGRVMRSRALFPVWGMRIRFDLVCGPNGDPRCHPNDVVAKHLNDGGTVAGVGAWRIELKGEYGRFEARWLSKV